MRALVFRGEGAVDHTTVEDPELVAEGDAIVELEAAGLCGSDLHPYLGREPARGGVVPGHEGVGRVVATGSAVTLHSVGDRVVIPFTTSCDVCRACRADLSSRCERGSLFGWGDPDVPSSPALPGMQAQLVRVPLADTTLFRIGETLSIEAALLLSDNLPTGWYAAKRADVAPGRPLTILGAGSVGICAAAAAMHFGVDPSHIIVIDPVDERRRIVESALGVRVLDPAHDDLGKIEDTTSIVDAAGSNSSQALAVHLAGPGATVSMIAVQTEPVFGFSPIDLYDGNLTVRSGRAPVRSLLPEVTTAIRAGTLVDPSQAIFTHCRVPLSEGGAMYRRFADRSDGVLKAWFDPAG